MLVLLSVLLLSSHVQSQTCDEKTEYLQKDQCCKKCEPGQFMEKRCGSLTDTQCGVCSEGYYMDVHNVNYKRCNHCTFCTKEHMKYKQICTSTSDAVCTCDDGYRCSDLECKMCVKVQTNTPTPRPATTKTALTSKNMTCKNNCMPTSDGMYTCDDGYRCSDSKCKMCVEVETNTPSPPFTTTKTSLHPHDNVWISLSLCVACVCVCVLFTCFLLISRHARQCGWIMSASVGLWHSKKSNYGSSQCTEEEEVQLPVQEVCGKTETQEDV